MNLIVAAVSMDPDVGELPGGKVLQSFADGAGGWGLVLALIALVLSAVVWAFGANSQNYQYAVAGRRGVLIAVAAALLIGAAPALINFFHIAGTGV